jgi:hypothetical protein
MNKKRNQSMLRRQPRILLIVLIVALIVTNPTKEDFFEWIETQAIESSESTFGGALTNLFVSPLLKSITVRKDYFFCSTYTIEIDDDRTVYLGIFRRFIELKNNN